MAKNRMTIIALLIALTGGLLHSINAGAATKKKLQEISFSEMDVQGSARTPDGTYLVQRRGLRFLPLYEVKKDLDQKIRKATGYLR